jgi:hypothetical protein
VSYRNAPVSTENSSNGHLAGSLTSSISSESFFKALHNMTPTLSKEQEGKEQEHASKEREFMIASGHFVTKVPKNDKSVKEDAEGGAGSKEQAELWACHYSELACSGGILPPHSPCLIDEQEHGHCEDHKDDNVEELLIETAILAALQSATSLVFLGHACR